MTVGDRPVSAPGAGDRDDAPKSASFVLAEAAEAEALAAEAEARAAAARARAERLRRQAEAASSDRPDGRDTATPHADDTGPDAPAADTGPPRHRRLRHPGIKVTAVCAGLVLICASLAASGYMVWRDHAASQQKHRIAEYAAAARRDVAALMSLDFNKTKEDLQRIEDNSTGRFKSTFPAFADQLSKRLQQSKMVTTVTVNDVAVESMTDDSAIVLVAATTQATGPDGQLQPQPWHIALGLRRDGGQPKMSSIEFVQ
ncbi:hypothetical protein [Mycobacterium botniense]|uniref:Mce associated membrane protein n=1 Tax=Mycobacterium botniense TaxID=84962 RepID=A0A7I9XXI5_9MYCO|nr:hypothetical protein [Mycobacterium botniense]GFG74509.1 hypothetical protein MBOT_18740 [Mycobacterium botniense]